MKHEIEYISLKDDLPDLEGRATALGFFDGIHLGHRKIIKTAVDRARQAGLRSCVLTFSDFPSKDFRALTTLDEKLDLIRETGADEVVCIRFTDDIRSMPADVFYHEILVKELGSKILVSGEDYTFGSKATGDTALLQRLAVEDRVETVISEDVMFDDFKSSSTMIRKCLSTGETELAVKLLAGKPFCYSGIVVEGKKLGRTLGFPTVNLKIPDDKYIVKAGVYRSSVILDGKRYPSVSNVGLRPTVEHADNVNCETYIYDFDRDIYGSDIRVELWQFVRPEMTFASVEELREQVERDKRTCASFWKDDTVVKL